MVAGPATSRTSMDNEARYPDRLRPPFLGDDAPERLIEIFAVPQERSAQHTFLYCVNLAEGAVATAIFQGRAGFEPMNTDHVEREFRGHPRAFDEHPGAPVFRRHCEPPLSSGKSGPEGPYLKQTSRRIHPARNDHEADVLSRLALPMRPQDEPFESFHRRRRRRDEARGLFGGQRE